MPVMRAHRDGAMVRGHRVPADRLRVLRPLESDLRALMAMLRVPVRQVQATLLALTLLIAAGVRADDAPVAFITNQGSHDVSVVDLRSGVERQRITVAAGPAGVAVDGVHGRAYVTSPDGRALTEIPVRQPGRQRVLALEGGPVGIALDALRERIYVADWFGNQLLVVDVQAWQIVQRIALGHVPAGVAVSPDGGRVYVAERDDDTVAVIGVPENRVLTRIAVGHHPFGLALDRTGRQLFAVNVLSNDVSVIDLQAAVPQTVATVPVGQTPYCAVWTDDQRLWVTNQHGDSVSVIDLASRRVIATIATGAFPEGIDVDGGRVLVVSWMDEELDVIDRVTLQVTRRIGLGHNSRGFGQFVWHPSTAGS